MGYLRSLSRASGRISVPAINNSLLFRVSCSRLLSGRDEPEKNELGFMYAAPPGLKQQQEKEEQEQARQQQLDNINLGDDREKFLQSIAVCPPSDCLTVRPQSRLCLIQL